jgi:hypothetical protein
MSYSRYDFYSDDPIAESPSPAKKKFSSIFAFLLLVVGGTYLVQTTLAANISLNTGAPVEFGQGVSATTACSGANNLTVTPNSAFTNVSGGGAHYFSSVTVSNIPSNCNGKDFIINAYGTSSSAPLAIFNSTSTTAVVYSNAGTFELGAGTASGASVTSGSGTFTLTFTTPVATSGSVFKITLQSSMHVQSGYSVGASGPGGGIIFYYSAVGFSCGSGFTSTGSPTGGLCNYLETAPSGWNSGSDPTLIAAVASYQNSDVPGITNEASAFNNASAIGLGYKNSVAIVTQNGVGTSYAAGAARGYSGGLKNDWYLPTLAEINLLCQWNRGVTQVVATPCAGGTINSGNGASAAGFVEGYYWTSSGHNSGYSWVQYLGGNNQGHGRKDISDKYVRPIRAF